MKTVDSLEDSLDDDRAETHSLTILLILSEIWSSVGRICGVKTKYCLLVDTMGIQRGYYIAISTSSETFGPAL